MNQQSQAAAERLRVLAAEIRQSAARDVLPEGSGRGLVIVAGGARIFTNAYVLLHVLRHVVRSSLPVELWYFGQSEISPAMAALLEPFDVRLVDATPLLSAAGANIRDGWQLKSFAMANSRFAEVLLLDADQVPVSDPAACFEWPEYQATGAVFWPDIVDLRKENAVWSLFGLEARRSVSLESGQMLVDRRRHGAPLSAAVRLNEAANDLYQLIYGDKDTYLLAWELLDSPYALVPHRPYRDEFILVQRDFPGNALFQHRTNSKWQYGAEPRRVANFVHEDACRSALSELALRWSGRVFTPPDRSTAAHALERQLVAVGRYCVDAADEPTIVVELRPHAELGAGRAVDRRHWWIEDADGKPRLILSDGNRRTYVLERGADRLWRGHRFRQPVVEVSLFPEDCGEKIAASEQPGLVDELLRTSGVFSGHAYDVRRLADSLRLLANVVPDLRGRLLLLASREADSDIAERLRSLGAALGDDTAPAHIDRTMKLEIGYIRAEIEG